MSQSMLLDTSVGELAAQQPRRTLLFEQLGIDFCCGGRMLLAEACERQHLDPTSVLEAIHDSDLAATEHPQEWNAATASLTELCDYIEDHHHSYLKTALPGLQSMIACVAKVHGSRDRWLPELLEVFSGFRTELEMHMFKEEQVLFPKCRQIETEGGFDGYGCGGLENPIHAMMAEHDDAGAALTRMHAFCSGYRVPEHACTSYKAMLDGLHTLETDMHVHVHLENNILFPAAMAASETAPSL
jgi:regulator of cell morphogenesis and NO signaling